MPVSSLPSKYGIGSFGKSAHDFIDFLDATGQKCWQVLPLNPTSYGDSPYQSPSSVAGNPYFIDLDILASEGLLAKEELLEQRNSSEKVNYGWLFDVRYKALRLAHSRFRPDAGYKKFVKKTNKFKVHDEENKAKMGDTVLIMETRHISKDKYYRLVEIIEEAK